MTAKWKPLYYHTDGPAVFEGEEGRTPKAVVAKVSYDSILRPVSLSVKGVLAVADLPEQRHYSQAALRELRIEEGVDRRKAVFQLVGDRHG